VSDAPVAVAERSGPVGNPVVIRRGPINWFRNPWRKPVFLEGITWAYLAWSILPVVIAIVFSFNKGRSRSSWQGFSLRWWTKDPTSLWRDEALRGALSQSMKLALLTMLVSVPLGVAFAIGIDRWRGRPAATANFAMLLSFVMPEIILGVSLLLVFTYTFKDLVQLGTTAQLLGLITFQVSYPVIIVRARLLTIGKEYEEAGMDLGATPTAAVRRVLLPLLYPAIFASAAIVFADTLDDFITVRYLSGPATSEPLAVKIFAAARSSPTPAVNAAAAALLVGTMVAAIVGLLLYRAFSKGERAGATGATEFAQL
jgi:spermidine/putrescine transport system permease protein